MAEAPQTLPTQRPILVGVDFGEATDDQRLACNKLAAAAFGDPLSEADYLEREELMSKTALAQDDGVRTWCLYHSNTRSQVLATCKTVKRQLLVTDVHGSHIGNGYCIASVVVHPDYRGQGYASALLYNVTQWLDGLGDALASMIYSNKEAFYARLGWSPIPAPAIVLSTDVSIDDEPHTMYGMQEHLRYLRAEDIDELCKMDIHTLALEIDETRTVGRSTILTVLPTADLIGWQHTRAEFYGMKLHKKSPLIKGAFHGSNVWIYWHHDFRKQCLFIQRIRILRETEGEQSNVLSALLLCAVREARSWGLPMVVVWGVASGLRDTFETLSSGVKGLSPMLQVQRRETISVKWRGGKSNRTEIISNEHYAWI